MFIQYFEMICSSISLLSIKGLPMCSLSRYYVLIMIYVNIRTIQDNLLALPYYGSFLSLFLFIVYGSFNLSSEMMHCLGSDQAGQIFVKPLSNHRQVVVRSSSEPRQIGVKCLLCSFSTSNHS
jgi:hypothetical protein